METATPSPPSPPFLRRQGPGWEPQAALAWWRWGSQIWNVWVGGAGSGDAVRALAARRLRDLVSFARARSPYYAGLYRSLPDDGDVGLRRLPPVTRGTLMAHFDEWVTDAEVTRASVEAFTTDLAGVGRPYLGRYAVWTSSGTSGEPGLFVHDGDALAVYDALEAVRLGQRSPLSPARRAMTAGGRYVEVTATGGHFVAVAILERLRAICPALAENSCVFSILEPLPDLVAALNAYQPSLVGTYPTAARVLAWEQESGRLAIAPSALLLGGETLSAAARATLRDAFDCEVMESYGASEAPSIACECGRGSLHVNADWAILEPVDELYRPVPPGEPSYTVLLTNLANRVQPIIRYDLGDSVTLLPEPCACGSALPALRVDGRSDEILAFRDPGGREIAVLPLALTTVVEECDGAHCFQVIQTAADAVSVRLGTGGAGPAGPARARRVQAALRDYFGAQGLANVTVGLDPAPPEREPRSGKLRRIVARMALKPA